MSVLVVEGFEKIDRMGEECIRVSKDIRKIL